MIDTALTIRGTATIERDVALSDLRVGDLVLGTPSPDTAPLRTLHRVTEAYGKHRIPIEAPSSPLERLASRFERGHLGVVVELVEAEPSNGGGCLAMFTEASTPTLDRATKLA